MSDADSIVARELEGGLDFFDDLAQEFSRRRVPPLSNEWKTSCLALEMTVRKIHPSH